MYFLVFFMDHGCNGQKKDRIQKVLDKGDGDWGFLWVRKALSSHIRIFK